MAGAKLNAIYPPPENADRFESAYHNEDVPMAVAKISGKPKIVATNFSTQAKASPGGAREVNLNSENS